LPFGSAQGIILPGKVLCLEGEINWMIKRLLVLLALAAIFTSACTVDVGEGLMEMTFNEDTPRSEHIYVEVGQDLARIEFILSAHFNHGSITVYVHQPEGGIYTLALGMTDSTQALEFNNPAPGKWRLEVHIDGNSQQIVDGNVRLSLKNK
jgi:hypothetical protein